MPRRSIGASVSVSARASARCRAEGAVRAGVPEAVATSNAQAFGLTAEGDAAWLSDEVASLTGTAPRSLRTFIADHMRHHARHLEHQALHV